MVARMSRILGRRQPNPFFNPFESLRANGLGKARRGKTAGWRA